MEICLRKMRNNIIHTQGCPIMMYICIHTNIRYDFLKQNSQGISGIKFSTYLGRYVLEHYDNSLSPHQNLDVSIAFSLDHNLNVQINTKITLICGYQVSNILYSLSHFSVALGEYF
jgi:hypothetical protein